MNKTKSSLVCIALAVALAVAGSAVSIEAQGISAAGTLSGVQDGANYDYTLTLMNTGNPGDSALESLWYAWIPGFFFLPNQPISASGASSGWTASVVANSIQFQGNAGNAIQPGGSATFTFVSSDSPTALAGMSSGHPIGESYAYTGSVDASPGVDFVVASVPEPTSLGLLIAGSIGLVTMARRKFRAQ